MVDECKMSCTGQSPHLHSVLPLGVVRLMKVYASIQRPTQAKQHLTFYSKYTSVIASAAGDLQLNAVSESFLCKIKWSSNAAAALCERVAHTKHPMATAYDARATWNGREIIKTLQIFRLLGWGASTCTLRLYHWLLHTWVKPMLMWCKWFPANLGIPATLHFLSNSGSSQQTTTSRLYRRNQAEPSATTHQQALLNEHL